MPGCPCLVGRKARKLALSGLHAPDNPWRFPLSDLVLWLDHLRLSDLGKVGGKNASLGEMIGNLSKLGVSVPGGFATTALAFQQFIAQSGLAGRIQEHLSKLDIDDVNALTKAGAEIRQWVIDTPLIPEFDAAVRKAYAKLCKDAGAALDEKSGDGSPVLDSRDQGRSQKDVA